MKRTTNCIVALLILAWTASALGAYPPDMPGSEAEVYKTVNGFDLKIYRYTPETNDAPKPAIVFFFGGGWRGGSPEQFAEHAEYLASRGMVAFVADYRVLSRNDVPAVECVKDAKAAVRWIRQNAKRLGVDPKRIVASGGSAGGHLAACTGLVPELEHDDEDLSVSSRPDALVLFNPATVLASYEGVPMDTKRAASLRKRLGVDNEAISPIHHVQQGNPPTILFHGTADTTVPFVTASKFAEAMKAAGNVCELASYDERAHGFFNWSKGDGSDYVESCRQMDRFLTELGYLTGEPTVTVPTSQSDSE
ncbi:MAG: alpha/beta hydrolase [Candidatus Hydrogenedentota bacterium]